MRPGRITLLLVLASSPVMPWKSSLAGTRSPHGEHFKFAVDKVLPLRFQGEGLEWQVQRGTLMDAATTYTGDGNSHGNTLLLDERIPDGSDGGTLDPNDAAQLQDALNFNSGPMYRWWTRMLESYSQANWDVPRLSFTTGPGGMVFTRKSYGGPRNLNAQPVSKTYEYMGNMIHLVQDNSSPAHAANVRHMLFDGVEWWHFQSNLLGGTASRGADAPIDSDAAGIAQQLDGGLVQEQMKLFFTQEGLNHTDRSSLAKYDARNEPRNPESLRPFIDQVLRGVIQDTRLNAMPDPDPVAGRMTDSRRALFGQAFLAYAGNNATGRKLTETQIKTIDAYERHGLGIFSDYPDRPLMGNPDLLPDFDPNANGVTDDVKGGYYANILHRLQGGNPFKPESAEMGTSLIADSSKYVKDPGNSWKTLNQGRALWLPHPNYIGGAFDLNWGSYGGYFGFPGRFPTAAQFFFWNGSIGGLLRTIFDRGQGAISPGDLYLTHIADPPGTYDPITPVQGRFHDERAFELIQPFNDSAIGVAQVVNSTLWTARILNGLSYSLPPLINEFRMVPRQITRPQISLDKQYKQPYMSVASDKGGQLHVSLGFNRPGTYYVRVFAIPKEAMARNLNSGVPTSSMDGVSSRPITFQNKRVGGVMPEKKAELFQTDIAFGRSYDFVYAGLPLFPLRVVVGEKSTSDFNLTTPSSQDWANAPLEIQVDGGATNGTDDAKTGYKKEFVLTWNGEAAAAQYIDSESPHYDASPYLNAPTTGPKTLTSREYFFFIKVYRQGWDGAFARNQYKFLSSNKEILEKYAWWNQPWDPSRLPSPLLVNQQIMIPDELIPILVDSSPVKVL